MDLVRKMEASEVTGDGHRPVEPIIVAHCGELELVLPPRLREHLEAEAAARKRKGRAGGSAGADDNERGRKKTARA